MNVNELPIKDKDGWYKNTDSGSIQCADTARYEKYMKAYYADIEEKEKNRALQNDVSELKSEMSEIKALLLTLANKEKT
tara:strand:+ start:7029 stop:7265 length:237 start_codon:yes stop_codon:yes gene_type:complete